MKFTKKPEAQTTSNAPRQETEVERKARQTGSWFPGDSLGQIDNREAQSLSEHFSDLFGRRRGG
jgi:hypothetical protein